MLGTIDIAAGSISIYDIIISTEYLSRVKSLKTHDLDRYAYLDDAHYMYTLCFVDQPLIEMKYLGPTRGTQTVWNMIFKKNVLKNTKSTTKKKILTFSTKNRFISLQSLMFQYMSDYYISTPSLNWNIHNKNARRRP